MQSPAALGCSLYQFLLERHEAHVVRGLAPLSCLTWVLSQPLDSNPNCWQPHSPPNQAPVPKEGHVDPGLAAGGGHVAKVGDLWGKKTLVMRSSRARGALGAALVCPPPPAPSERALAQEGGRAA